MCNGLDDTAGTEPRGRRETSGAPWAESGPGRELRNAWFSLHGGIAAIPPLKYARV